MNEDNVAQAVVSQADLPQPAWRDPNPLGQASQQHFEIGHFPTASLVQDSLGEMARRAQRLENVLKVLPGGVVVLDGMGLVQECNPAASDLLGEPLKAQLWREVVNRAFTPRWDDGHDISLASGRRVNIATQALEGEGGQILLIQDVTETRHLQEQVARHKRLSAKGEMAAALAHQIRTPLSSVILYLSNLTQRKLDEHIRRRFTEKALSRLRHLEKLVDDMLLFARGGSFDVEDIALQELIDSLTRGLEAQMAVGNFTLDLVEPVPEAMVRANRNALVSALQNLVTNAIEACGSEGCMMIEARLRSQTELELALTDNGPGVPAEIRETIFEPFVSTRSQGTGLGLAVAQTVVLAHGGSISLETVAPQSARFLIILPVVPAQHERKTSVGCAQTLTGVPQAASPSDRRAGR